MRIVRIPKRNGKFRTIYVPDEEEKLEYTKLLPQLNKIAAKVCNPVIVHGFMPGRSPVTNAIAHINREYTLSIDLKDFFDTVTFRHLVGLIPDELIDKVLVDGAARQGLPTSPIVSNIAAARMDQQIRDLLGKETIYTRYADDLTFSHNDKVILDVVLQQIGPIVEANRFMINSAKTHWQTAKGGRRIITGVAVDDRQVYPTRAVRRRLRAAIHQDNAASISGLQEWIKQKLPRGYREQLVREYNRLKAALLSLDAPEPVGHEYGKMSRTLQIDPEVF